MKDLIKTSHGFVMDAMNNGLKAARIGSHGGGGVEAGDLQVQVIEGIQQGAKVEVGCDWESQAVVSKCYGTW